MSRFRPSRVVLLAMLSNGVAASDALPNLELIDHVEHYLVTGHTARSIGEQLSSRSWSGSSGQGTTRSAFEVISKLEKVDGLCRVLHQEMVVEVTAELPHWEPRRKTSSLLQEEWRISVERLNGHEAGHRQNVLQAAALLREALTTLEVENSCLSARAGIDLEPDKTLRVLARREDYFDRLTQDGMRDLPGENDFLRAVDLDEAN